MASMVCSCHETCRLYTKSLCGHLFITGNYCKFLCICNMQEMSKASCALTSLQQTTIPANFLWLLRKQIYLLPAACAKEFAIPFLNGCLAWGSEGWGKGLRATFTILMPRLVKRRLAYSRSRSSKALSSSTASIRVTLHDMHA